MHKQIPRKGNWSKIGGWTSEFACFSISTNLQRDIPLQKQMSMQGVHNYNIFKAEKQKYEVEDLASLRNEIQVANGRSHNINQFALLNPKKLKSGK